MHTALWVFTILGSVIGGLILTVGVSNAHGAPQEASAAAIGVACAVIPYCLARAVTKLGDVDFKRPALAACPDCGEGIRGRL